MESELPFPASGSRVRVCRSRGTTFLTSSPVGASKTLQQFKTECDINFLVDRQKKTGSFYDPLSMVGRSPRAPMYGDFSDVPDIGDAFGLVSDISQKFMKLPSNVRAMFSNSPSALYAFVIDPANREECYRLGLLQRPSNSLAEPSASADRDKSEGKERSDA